MSRYAVDVGGAVEPFLERWAALLGNRRSRLPFHSLAWLRAWYATLGAGDGRAPLLVGLRERGSNADLMLVALASRRSAGLSIAEFADAGVCDYNLPLMAPGWAARDEGEAQAIHTALRQSLTAAGHDVLRLQKMPAGTLDDGGVGAPSNGAPPRANPLLGPTGALRPSEVAGTQVALPADWNAWRFSLDKTVRKEFERSWRVFTRSPAAAFERVTEHASALSALEALEAMQSRRMHALGKPYRLDAVAYRNFYRGLLEHGLANGDVVLTMLRDGATPVAALLGVSNGQRYIALRTANAGAAWSHCSPGRLLLERTAGHLHAGGDSLRRLDLGIGDYAYKQVFNGQRIPLFDSCTALSWRGAPWVWAWRLRQATKASKASADLNSATHAKPQA